MVPDGQDFHTNFLAMQRSLAGLGSTASTSQPLLNAAQVSGAETVSATKAGASVVEAKSVPSSKSIPTTIVPVAIRPAIASTAIKPAIPPVLETAQAAVPIEVAVPIAGVTKAKAAAGKVALNNLSPSDLAIVSQPVAVANPTSVLSQPVVPVAPAPANLPAVEHKAVPGHAAATGKRSDAPKAIRLDGQAATAATGDLPGAVGTASVVGSQAVAVSGASGLGGHLATAVGSSDPFHGAGIEVTAISPVAVTQVTASHRASSAEAGKLGASGSTGAADGYGEDGVGGLSAPRMLSSSANVLEVGITGGAHGWLRVRAEMGHTGEVTASLVASNAASAESLDKQLGAISAFLKTETVGVSALVVTAPARGTGVDVSAGSSQGQASGSTSGSGGQERQSRQEFAGFGLQQFGTSGVQQPQGSGLNGSSALASAAIAGGSGGWVNVRV
jgi:hypothetical protein